MNAGDQARTNICTCPSSLQLAVEKKIKLMSTIVQLYVRAHVDSPRLIFIRALSGGSPNRQET